MRPWCLFTLKVPWLCRHTGTVHGRTVVTSGSRPDWSGCYGLIWPHSERIPGRIRGASGAHSTKAGHRIAMPCLSAVTHRGQKKTADQAFFRRNNPSFHSFFRHSGAAPPAKDALPHHPQPRMGDGGVMPHPKHPWHHATTCHYHSRNATMSTNASAKATKSHNMLPPSIKTR